MNERMYLEVKQILSEVEGDIIDFRVYKGGSFSHLVKLAKEFDRVAVGTDTFYGLEAPSALDFNEDNHLNYPKGYAKASIETVHNTVKLVCPDAPPYEIYPGKLSEVLPILPKRKYALAVFDLLHYYPTKEAIEYVHQLMATNGVMYFLNNDKNSRRLASGAVTEFIEQHYPTLYKYPDIYYNDNRLNVCRIAVKQDIVDSTPVKVKVKNDIKKKRLNDTVNLALVLRTGGDTYDYRYVNAVAENVRNHSNSKLVISCLTNDSTGIDPSLVDEIIPLQHNYPGWWSKVELFRPNIFSCKQVLYMDLDTVVVDNIDDILHFRSDFAGIRDMFHKTFLQTGVMSWNPELNTHLYTNFVPRAQAVMNNYPQGDASWIRENSLKYDYLCDKFPRKIVSYKAHCLQKDRNVCKIPQNASIVCFHGKPRPHTVLDKAITQHWKYNR